ncbi:alpha/beta hydrolase [Methylobacterium planeticum]|uniref:Alpha/beta hydrolase n=1 Tax=Methylobacterium planeticum TaxID=2615211 RepID=A0A6N6MLT3_9HYPH|nr:alpha/beta hydrolase [Methylobacterium planeticum]KAB1071642.1 alpha/beta hydrolase [Methylobacterium planeticum]
MIDRRSLIAALAAASLPGMARAQPAPERLPLWPQEPPGGGDGPSGPLATSEAGAISNIARPFLEIFAPAQPNGTAVLIAAGGGYRRIAVGREAYPAALWLNQQGVTAFVLTYRLPREGWAAGPLAPLQDAQRALRLVRAEAGRRQLDRKRVGSLGFSAGGHLLGMASVRSAFRSYPAGDAVDDASARPDFTALLYPVITLEPPYQHTSTCRELVGPDADPAASAEWSVQTHVRGNCPPMFLAQADDDRISDPANTRLLAEACSGEGVPVEWDRFESGGHGFAMGRPGTPTEAWPGRYRDWMVRLGVLA